jgi:hypothetical protein
LITVRLGCIVEGHGETKALPILLRRIAFETCPECGLAIPHPIRVPRSKLLKAGELERHVELAAEKVAPNGAVIVLLDADDDCPAQLAPELLNRARAARPDVPLCVVLARREFESWFLAAASSLGGHRGLPAGLEPPANAELIRGAKEWLGERMAVGRYSETVDQPALTQSFDLAAARTSPSFDKFYREVSQLLNLLRTTGEPDFKGSSDYREDP